MRNNQPVTGIEHPMRENKSLISRTDTRGKIAYANQDFIEMSGFSEKELLSAPHNVVRHLDIPEEAFDDLWLTLKSGNSWAGIVKNRRKHGDHYWALANAAPILENDTVIGYASVRTAPDRVQIEATARVYAQVKEGQESGLRIRRDKTAGAGVIGRMAGLMDMHINPE